MLNWISTHTVNKNSDLGRVVLFAMRIIYFFFFKTLFLYCSSGADIFQSRVKLPYFWCNFCSFDTESKPNLLQHLVSEHCFLCYHCQYAAFSRNDVIQHSIREHPEFREQVKYCVIFQVLFLFYSRWGIGLVLIIL